jgi:hypothetical protein
METNGLTPQRVSYRNGYGRPTYKGMTYPSLPFPGAVAGGRCRMLGFGVL